MFCPECGKETGDIFSDQAELCASCQPKPHPEPVTETVPESVIETETSKSGLEWPEKTLEKINELKSEAEEMKKKEKRDAKKRLERYRAILSEKGKSNTKEKLESGQSLSFEEQVEMALQEKMEEGLRVCDGSGHTWVKLGGPSKAGSGKFSQRYRCENCNGIIKEETE